MTLPMDVHRFTIPSPLGMLSGLCTQQHFLALAWNGFPAVLQKMPSRFSEKRLVSTLFFEQLNCELEEFFTGRRTQFSLPIELHGSDFQKKVWRALQTIPYGSTTTYAQVATQIGQPSSTRAVANAVAANPLLILIPCHRVIGHDGKLRGFSGGIDNKRTLLKFEGHTEFKI